MKIALITAGGAGMFCGSCMQDNTLVRALRLAGHDAVLVPTYTPIRVDEVNASSERVFLGGINVYLDSKIPGFRYLPRWTKSWLDRPAVIRMLTRFGTSTDAAGLGSLTLDMLKGSAGPQRSEYKLFVDYLCDELRPDVIVFSNALLSGVMGELRGRFSGRIECLLQGDDVFLKGLTSKWKPRVLDQLRQNCRQFDGFLTHSNYYSDFMSTYLGIDRQSVRRIPLTMDVDDPAVADDTAADDTAADDTAADDTTAEPASSDAGTSARIRIGYFARICPEKGAGQFLDAAAEVLNQRQDVEYVISGFLPKQHERWFSERYQRITQQFPDNVFWLGSPADRDTKFRYLKDFAYLCVPTEYHEPKGLYVLEAAIAGTPSIVPAHGAFPELIDSLNFGTLYDPAEVGSLVAAMQDAIQKRLTHVDSDREESQRVRATIIRDHGMEHTGQVVGELLGTSQNTDRK